MKNEIKSLVVYTYYDERGKMYIGIVDDDFEGCYCKGETLEELNNRILEELSGRHYYSLRNEFVDSYTLDYIGEEQFE